MPAEWEPQAGIMLTWPHDRTDWREDLDAVYAFWAQLTAAISRHEPVLLVCRDDDHQRVVLALSLDAGAREDQLHPVIAASNDAWARDHGPVTVLQDDDPLLLDFAFNAWGQKYPYTLDDAISRTLRRSDAFPDVPMEPVDLVLEGGAIETDGAGTLLAIDRTLRDPMRNPGLSRGAIERILSAHLGVYRFLWLEHGHLSGDDTDGHIDTLARFCDPHTICYVRCDNPADTDYSGLKAMEAELAALRDADGQPYRLVPLPCPAPVVETRGELRGLRLPAGYANFLILNNAVVVPTYADAADEQAIAVIDGLFPGREIIALDCRELIRRRGSLHCVTMQLPEPLRLGSPQAIYEGLRSLAPTGPIETTRCEVEERP